MKILMFVVAFLFIGAFFIVSTENLHIGRGAEFNQFMTAYYSWFSDIFTNVKATTGYVVKMDWLP